MLEPKPVCLTWPKTTFPGHLIVQGLHWRYLPLRTARGSPVRSALTGPLAPSAVVALLRSPPCCSAHAKHRLGLQMARHCSNIE